MLNSIPLDEISLSKANAYFLRLDEPVDDLVESIKEVGLINPLIIDPNKNLLSGARRYRALRILGWEMVNCICYDQSDVDCEIMAIDDNLARREFSQAKQALMITRRRRLYECKHDGIVGFTTQTAEKLGITKREVERQLKRAKEASPKVLKKWEEGEITTSAVDKLIAVPAEEQDKLVDIAHSKTRDELGHMVRGAKESELQFKLIFEKSKMLNMLMDKTVGYHKVLGGSELEILSKLVTNIERILHEHATAPEVLGIHSHRRTEMQLPGDCSGNYEPVP